MNWVLIAELFALVGQIISDTHDNDSYKAIRGHILLLNPLPVVRQACPFIVQEEK
jgi:hypothetical protein